jgi:integrase
LDYSRQGGLKERSKDEYHRVTYSIALMCGLREREIMHLEWQDIDRERRTLRVRSRPQWDFKVKDSEERSVPIPGALLGLLKDWREKRPKHQLVTGTKTDKPNGKLLRTLKRTVSGYGDGISGWIGGFIHDSFPSSRSVHSY